MTFDSDGNLWLSTDGQPKTFEVNDGLFAVPVDGPERGYLRQFFSAVPGAEVSGPVFTPDNTSLFLSVQHPGEGRHPRGADQLLAGRGPAAAAERGRHPGGERGADRGGGVAAGGDPALVAPGSAPLGGGAGGLGRG
jgi:secreted PhoX family phosphatase